MFLIFLKRLGSLTLGLGALVVLIHVSQESLNFNFTFTYISLVYFFALNLLTFFISKSAMNKSNKIFIQRIFSAMGIRFVFTIFPLVYYLIFYPNVQLSFCVVYLILYFFFTSFEIYFFVITLRPNFKK